MGPLSIQPMRAQNWPDVRAIYQAGIDTGHATFESEAPGSFETWLQDVYKRQSLKSPSSGT